MSDYPEQKSHSPHFFMILTGILFLILSCEKKNQDSENKVFKLTSPEIGSDSLLPVTFTCDGESATLPVEWSGYPENTSCFALIMHHEASPSDIHWYWVIYNIPVTVNSITKNGTGIGTLGNNSVNDKNEYASPCSQGPGPKKYIYTVYALSEPVTIPVTDSLVTRAVLLSAIKNITIDSTKLIVIYTRNF
jgi:phosphatidylethanolamine-binding protein (PEBP) family uncharacterized protein